MLTWLRLKRDDIESVIRTNVTSVHWVSRAFIPLLERGNLRKIINV